METQPSVMMFPCKHIRAKEMYYQADEREGDAFASGVYWCTCTHQTFGPDGQPVDRSECNPGRGCYRG